MSITDHFQVDDGFPTFIRPRHEKATPATLIKLFTEENTEIRQRLLKTGALVFRGFSLEHADHFQNAIESLKLGEFVNYIGGDSPRDKVKAKVYTSTEAPPSLHIPLHNELSFVKHYPKHIYFFCETAAPTGGATVIGDARKIYQSMPSHIKNTFIKHGLCYTSRYYGNSPIMRLVNRFQRAHKSWKEVFESTSPADVEQRCKESDFKWRWLNKDWIEIQQNRPAILQHPTTSEAVWFNQAHLYDFNPRLLGWPNYLAAKLFYARRSTLLHEIHYTDGSRVARRDLYQILDVLDKHTVSFPWESGDMMVLDNVLTMHGRAPFKGKRRVLTALTA